MAGDLLWYPVEGDNKTCQALDAMVVLGRPKGDSPEATLSECGSYQQWKEGGIAPQVVFEIRSPCNTPAEMNKKLGFYDRRPSRNGSGQNKSANGQRRRNDRSKLRSLPYSIWAWVRSK